MGAMSRREFLTDAAVAGFVAAAASRPLEANPLGLPIGSQTYPHRQMIKDGNFAGLLKMLKDIGVESIELCSPIGYADFASLSDGKQVKKILARPRPQVRELSLQHARAAGRNRPKASPGPRKSASRR